MTMILKWWLAVGKVNKKIETGKIKITGQDPVQESHLKSYLYLILVMLKLKIPGSWSNLVQDPDPAGLYK